MSAGLTALQHRTSMLQVRRLRQRTRCACSTQFQLCMALLNATSLLKCSICTVKAVPGTTDSWSLLLAMSTSLQADALVPRAWLSFHVRATGKTIHS
jgi:hypothetical protein